MPITIKPILNSSSKGSESCTLLGPWLGEFGFELIYWQGFVRRYCLTHPGEYVIVCGHYGNGRLYELADEYWNTKTSDPLEPNMYLPGWPRSDYYYILSNLEEQGILPDRIGLPDQIHEHGWIEFGRPAFNQNFIPLRPTVLMKERLKLPKSYALLFTRFRSSAPEKNWSVENWRNLALSFQREGIEPVFSGGYGQPRIDGFLNSIDLSEGLDSIEWMDFQLALVDGCQIVVSGESGPGFLPGLCCKPGVIFGSPVESKRYCQTENIFSSPIRYIPRRDPDPLEVLCQAMELQSLFV